jgi:membrane protein DedA with SNARE-associated domain
MAALPPGVHHAIGKFGYGAVAAAVGIESAGVPVPGETTLVGAALYAGTTHELNIVLLVTVAAAAAIVGDNIGFWVGREIGLPMLERYGRYVGMTPPRIKLGQYLFRLHGGKVVFFGRFVAVLRALAALLAGANRMAWPRFLAFNAAGAVVWASAYGFGAYFLGDVIKRLAAPVGIGLGAVALVLIVAGAIFLKRNEQRLEEQAEKALPGR